MCITQTGILFGDIGIGNDFSGLIGAALSGDGEGFSGLEDEEEEVNGRLKLSVVVSAMSDKRPHGFSDSTSVKFGGVGVDLVVTSAAAAPAISVLRFSSANGSCRESPSVSEMAFADGSFS